MGTAERWASPGAGRSVPGIRLLQPRRGDLSPQLEAARRRALAEFVDDLRAQYAELWPALGTTSSGPVERSSRRFPWPTCWALHAGFVSRLELMKAWHDALVDGDEEAGGYRGGADWLGTLRNEIALSVRDISKVCMLGGGKHKDVGLEPPIARRPGPVAPSLPWIDDASHSGIDGG